MSRHSSSFEIMLNNFKASYFAVALLMPEEHFIDDVKRMISQAKWNTKSWLDLLNSYDVTPEMMMQRLTNILPRHFSIGNLFLPALEWQHGFGSFRDHEGTAFVATA